MKKRILSALLSLFKVQTSEFWTGPVNGVAQVILRHVPGELAPAATHIADGLAMLFPYAAGRVISKFARPTDPK